MSRPEGIPDDVWTAACACVSAPDRLGYAKAYTDLIARAILAAKLEEREACVKAATDEITLLLGDQFADTINGYVAEAIRSRP